MEEKPSPGNGWCTMIDCVREEDGEFNIQRI